MKKFLLTIAYDGSDYIGWQRQDKLHGISIQQTVEKALSEVLREQVAVQASGRTDSGVHALGQTAHFVTEKAIPAENLPRALNNLLPASVRILDACEVDEAFHARFSVKEKTYRYYILLNEGQIVTPFISRYVWVYPDRLDFEAMREAAALFVGIHDFRRFCVTGSSVSTYEREIYRAELALSKAEFLPVGATNREKLLCFEICGSGFLYKMVRIIVARLIEVGQGRLNLADICALLKGSEDYKSAVPAPPQGLFLYSTKYPTNILIK